MTDPTRDSMDGRLRSALRGLPLPGAPEALRLALETLPERAAGEPARRRWWSPGLAVAAVVLVAIVGVAGLLGLTRIPATPAATASPSPAEPSASVTVLDAAGLRAAIAAQRAGGLAPQWVVTSVGIDASRLPEPATRECSPQGSCAVIGILDGFDDPHGTVTLRVEEDGVPLATTPDALVPPVALRLAGTAPIEFLGHVDLAAGRGVLDVPGLIAATDTADAGHVMAVDAWLVGVDAFSCGPAMDPALPPPFACDPLRALLTAEPVKPLVRNGNQTSMTVPGGAVRVQVGAYDQFAANPASDGTNDEPRRAVYLVRMVVHEAPNCEGCRGWLMVGRLDGSPDGTTAPPATAAPASAVILRSAAELEALLAADRAAWVGRPVFIDGAIEPGTAQPCAPDASTCDLGTLAGTDERVFATGYTTSLLAPDMTGPLDGATAMVVREGGLQYLGWLGWSDPLGYETTVQDLMDLASKPRGPMVTTVKGWLVAGLPTPCPAPSEPLGEDTPFDWCPPAWLTRDEVQPVTGTGGSSGVREPEVAVRVQYSAYGTFAADAARDPGSGLVSPRFGTYVVRLVTDTRTGDADSGTKGWQVVGRLDPDPELGPPADPGPAPTPAPAATPDVTATPAPTARPQPSGAPTPAATGRFDTVALSPDGRTVTITFAGGKPYRADDPCSNAYEAWAQVAGDTLYVTVVDVTPAGPDGETPGPCDAMAYGRTVAVTLPEPFAGYRVQDLAGYVHFLRAPPGLAELAGLPDPWRLTSEADVDSSPTGRWVRTWTLDGDTAEGPGRLDLYQAFAGPADVMGGDSGRPVPVHGTPATLYRYEPTGELVLVWSLEGDGLALVANEADFTEAALIRLAESAVIPAR